MKPLAIQALIEQRKFDEALSGVEDALTKHADCPYLWNLRGDLIQLIDHKSGPPLEESVRSYSKALETNPNDLEALEGLAHFYDKVDCKPDQARKFAIAFLERARKSTLAMEKILSDEIMDRP